MKSIFLVLIAFGFSAMVGSSLKTYRNTGRFIEASSQIKVVQPLTARQVLAQELFRK